MSELLLKTNLLREPKTMYFVKEVDGFLGVFKCTEKGGRKKSIKKSDGQENSNSNEK